jgi:hypothetical protein
MKSTVFDKFLPDRFAYKLKPPKQLLDEIERLRHFPQKCKFTESVWNPLLSLPPPPPFQMTPHFEFDNMETDIIAS